MSDSGRDYAAVDNLFGSQPEALLVKLAHRIEPDATDLDVGCSAIESSMTRSSRARQ